MQMKHKETMFHWNKVVDIKCTRDNKHEESLYMVVNLVNKMQRLCCSHKYSQRVSVGYIHNHKL